ncbi:MAG: pilus (MSHA type) biogenesis protein MshL, partial [Thiotrichales bacterium]|nr:pilus (MSHA type) biogenesis protein MshL [Thiotrichales bacterium]
VNGTVTINAINQDLPTILKRMSDQLGFLYDITADSIVVKHDEPFWKSYEVDYVNIKKVSQDTIDMKMAVGGASSLGGSATSTGGSAANVKIEATHDFWAELEENLSRIVGAEDTNASAVNAPTAVNKNVVLNEEAGVITIFSTGKVHKIVKDYLEKTIDRATRQVLIEATVVEVQLSDEYQAGVDWSAPIKSGGASGTIGQTLALTAYGTGSPFSGVAAPLDISFGDLDWNVAMKFLQQFGNTKVLSSPKIMAVNNQTALLKVVDNQVYFTITVNKDTTTTTGGVSTPSYTYETEVHTVPVGFMMNVTPFVGEGDSVTLNVRPTISRIIDSVQDPSPDLRLSSGLIESKIPVVQEREMSSVLKLRDKQTAIIGGLIEDSNSNEKNAVPWVNEIPLFGDLFSYKNDQARKSELIIFIRPIVVKNPDVDNGDLSLLRDFLKTDHN